MYKDPENRQDETFGAGNDPNNNQSNLFHFVLVLLGLAYNTEQLEIDSSKQPEEIITSLKANVNFSWFGGHPFKAHFVGRLKDNSFRVWWYSPGRRNSWIPVLYGTVERTSSGSKIRAHFDIDFGVKIFTSAWLGALLVVIFLGNPFWKIPMLPVYLSNLPTFFALGMILFMLLCINVGRLLGKSDHTNLISLLEKISKPDMTQSIID